MYFLWNKETKKSECVLAQSAILLKTSPDLSKGNVNSSRKMENFNFLVYNTVDYAVDKIFIFKVQIKQTKEAVKDYQSQRQFMKQDNNNTFQINELQLTAINGHNLFTIMRKTN